MLDTNRTRILIGISIAFAVALAFVIGMSLGSDGPETTVAGVGSSTSTTTTSTDAGSSSTTTARPPADLPRPVVISQGYVLGFWNGSGWTSLVSESFEDDIPTTDIEGGEPYAFVDMAGKVRTGPLGPRTDGCHLETHHEVDEDRPGVGLPDGYELLPRRVQQISAAADHVAAVADWLSAEGISDPDVHIDRVTRLDIEGDGQDEVLIEASRMANDSLLGEDEGDYSVVLYRYVDASDQARTVVVEGDVVTAEEAEGDSFAGFLEAFELVSVADLDQDGEFEVVVGARYYEGSSVAVHDVTGAGSLDQVLGTGCGA